ncbi:TIGR02452 family protein [Micromonospora sp. SL1-18]|uniref:TIGR02452 family protein n=1 Tax=Micromonospora sp. SL1-18 TaxID=3399128 RepID=UPI003A4D8559
MITRLRAIARDTLDILDAGRYINGRGETVHLADPVRAAVAGTRLHLPDDPLPTPPVDGAGPAVEVTGESTLLAARRLAADGDVAALVFASAKNPGGGFRTGAQAQEESIARASALFPCLMSVPEFYSFHREQRDLLYSNRIIHSPRVPVFRDDKGRLLDDFHEVSFLTAAAPNRGAVLRNQPADTDEVGPVLRIRARGDAESSATTRRRWRRRSRSPSATRRAGSTRSPSPCSTGPTGRCARRSPPASIWPDRWAPSGDGPRTDPADRR